MLIFTQLKNIKWREEMYSGLKGALKVKALKYHVEYNWNVSICMTRTINVTMHRPLEAASCVTWKDQQRMKASLCDFSTDFLSSAPPAVIVQWIKVL